MEAVKRTVLGKNESEYRVMAISLVPGNLRNQGSTEREEWTIFPTKGPLNGKLC